MGTRHSIQTRRFGLVVAGLALVLLGIAALAWHHTMGPPVVRETVVTLPGLDQRARPVRIALISDLHVVGPEMPPARLSRIVEQINALDPDIVMIAGDLMGDRHVVTRRYSAAETVAPLGQLRAPMGVFAVPGNHDHWTDLAELSAAMAQHGVTLLINEAARAGPLAIGGLDDAHTGRHDFARTLAAMNRHGGAPLILSHSPDAFPAMPGSIGLMLAGHTHCGQIGWPWGGAPITMSRFGQRYACGRVDEGGKTLVTTAGLGNSGLPIRLFARPDIWLIEARPADTIVSAGPKLPVDR